MKNLTDADRAFLLGFQNGTPDWGLSDCEDHPAVQWKWQNLKGANQEKHKKQISLLKKELEP